LSAFTGIEQEAIVLLPNARTVYEVPLTLESQGIGEVIIKKLGLSSKKLDHHEWRDLVSRATTHYDKKVTVGIVAKYMDNEDTYMSVFEALRAAAWKHEIGVELKWIEAESLEKSEETLVGELSACDGIVVPGGFGPRGVEGKIKAAQYALKQNMPYLGLCLGLQIAVIAAARSAGLENANSTEMNPETSDPVIATMGDQIGKEETGGTMRLGNYPCVMTKGSVAAQAYGATKIEERHRHRYECNNDYRDRYESWGIKASGLSPDGNLVEMIEGVNHPFLLASQFHPELKSRPNKPHPMFDAFIKFLKNNQK
jgi:CTP synthase